MNAGEELRTIATSTTILADRVKAHFARRKRESNPFEESEMVVAISFKYFFSIKNPM